MANSVTADMDGESHVRICYDQSTVLASILYASNHIYTSLRVIPGNPLLYCLVLH